MVNRPKPLVLLIPDGFGYSTDKEYNAIAMAKTACWDQLQKDYPMTLINCSGSVVGLPDDQMGSSGVGPLCIGATMLDRLGVEKPIEMTGRSLLASV